MSTGGAKDGSTTATWVMSAKFSCSSMKLASVVQAPPSVDHDSSTSHGALGGLRRPARPGSANQTQTRPSCSRTGKERTRASYGISVWVGTRTHDPSAA